MRNVVSLLLAAACACTPVDRTGPAGRRLPSLPIQDLAEDYRIHSHDATWVDAPLLADLGPSWQLRAQRLRGYLGPDRIVLVDRSDNDPDWTVSLRLARWGSPGALSDVPAGATAANGSLFESRRPGLTEWVQAVDEGLEHGFTLHRVPAGPTTVLELAVDGGRVRATDDGAWIRTSAGAVGWRGLYAYDADLRSVPARTETPDAHTLRVVLDTANAKPPITVDPILAVDEAIVPIGQAGYGGFAIDLDGDRILAGDPGDPNAATPAATGTATLLLRNTVTSGDWLTAATWDGTRAYGYDVALDGTTVAIAHKAIGAELVVEVYDYLEDANTWRTDVPVATVGPNANSIDGVLVDLDGDLIVAGKPGYNTTDGILGTWIRDPIDDSWSDGPTLIGTADSRLGAAVDLDHRTVAVGAPGSGTNGTVRMVEVEIDATLTNQTITAPVGAIGFGSSVALSNTWVAVGSPGSSKVFTYVDEFSTPIAWSLKQTISPPVLAGANFGSTVAIEGQWLAATDLPTSGSTARVHLYERSGSTWDYVDSFDIGPAGALPMPVELSPNLLVVGLPDDSAVRVWGLTGDTWELLSSFASPASATGSFGAAAAVDGELAVIGAPLDDTFGVDAGVAEVYYRDPDGTWTHPFAFLTEINGATGDQLGSSVVIKEHEFWAAGAPQPTTGTGYVWLLAYTLDSVGGGWYNTGQFMYANAAGTGQRFGEAMAADGNRILVGKPGFGTTDTGRAELWARGATGTFAYVDALIPSATVANDQMGASVALLDRYMVIGSGTADGATGVDAGRLEVFERRELDPVGQPGVFSTVEIGISKVGAAAGDKLGAALATGPGLIAASATGVDKVYVYGVGSAGGLLDLLHTVTGSGSDYGEELAIDGDRLIVGVPDDNKVEIRVRNQGGTDAWGLDETLTGAAGSKFGSALAADAGTVVIGESGASDAAFYELTAAHAPPHGRTDVYVIDENAALTNATSVLANDTDANDNTLTVALADAPDHAKTFTFDADGTFDYAPATNWCHDDTFTYTLSDGDALSIPDPVVTVELNILCINSTPVASDLVREADEATDLSTYVTGNLISAGATDAEGTGLTLVSVIPTGGTPPGLLTFEPDGDYTFHVPTAPATFTYDWEVEDYGDPPEDPDKDSATAQLTVSVLHRAPIIRVSLLPPLVGDEDHALWLPGPGLLDPNFVYSPGGFPLTVVPLVEPTHGRVILGDSGELHYIPDRDWNGDDALVYTVDDGIAQANGSITVDFRVLVVPDPPVPGADGPFTTQEDTPLHLSKADLLANDTDVDTTDDLLLLLDLSQPPEHGSVTETLGALDYVPAADYFGTDIVWYAVFDGQTTSEPVGIEITVAPVNDAPRGEGAVYKGVDGVLADVVAVIDPEGDPFTCAVATPPTLGTVNMSVNGAFSYTPRPGASGEDSFVYEARDAFGARSNWAQVTLTLAGDTTPGTGTQPGTDTACTPVEWYVDGDHDGHGTPDFHALACDPPAGYVPAADDCDDSRADRYAGAPEVAGDGVDQDCDRVDNVAVPVGCSTTGSGSGGLVLLLLALGRRGGARVILLALLGLARAQSAESACGADPSADVDQAVLAVNDAFRKVDETSFDRASKALTAAISCLDRAPAPKQVVEIHKAMALASFVNGQIRACRRSLVAARLLDPSWLLDDDMFPASHPYRDLFAAATDPGPVEDIGRITPDAWVVDGVVRNEAPIERGFLLQVSEGGRIVWSGYLWDFEEIPDRGQALVRSVMESPHEWWLGLRVHGGGLYARQEAEAGAAALTDQRGSTFASGADLVVRYTPITVIGGELTAAMLAPSDPVLGGGGEPSLRAVALVGGAGWVDAGQPWVAARLGCGLIRVRNWTNGLDGDQADSYSRTLLVGGLEGGLRNERTRVQGTFDGGVVAPWNPYGWQLQVDGGQIVTGSVAIEGLLAVRHGGLPFHDQNPATVVGAGALTDFRIGGGVGLWY